MVDMVELLRKICHAVHAMVTVKKKKSLITLWFFVIKNGSIHLKINT